MADILLVADVSWVASGVHAALSEARFSIKVIDDPRAVAEAVAASRPDVILVDFQVGSMGGMAVTRAVRHAAAADGVRRPTIVLLLDRDADAFLAGRSGADAWVRKPFSTDDLRRTIDSALEGATESS
ncbi:MAG: response regulator [Acidimicrobiia bacterium]